MDSAGSAISWCATGRMCSRDPSRVPTAPMGRSSLRTGAWIGYFANGKLYKVAAGGGGPPAQVADGANPILAGGAWLADGRIVFNSPGFALMAVPASGGPATLVARPPENGGDDLSDGVAAEGCPAGDPLRQQLRAAGAHGDQPEDPGAGHRAAQRVARVLTCPMAPWSAILQDGSVVGAPFDLAALRFKRPPAALLGGVQSELGIIPEFAVADDGTMVYLPSNALTGRATPAEVDRTGKSRVLDPAWLGRFTSMSLSPDGRRVAVGMADGSEGMLWVKQLDAGPLTRLTFGGTINYRGAWMADGRSLSFSSDMQGPTTFLYGVRGRRQQQARAALPHRYLADRRGRLVPGRTVGGVSHRHHCRGARPLCSTALRRHHAYHCRRRPFRRIHAGAVARRPLDRLCLARVGTRRGVCAPLPPGGPGPVAGFARGRDQPGLGPFRPRALLPRRGIPWWPPA